MIDTRGTLQIIRLIVNKLMIDVARIMSLISLKDLNALRLPFSRDMHITMAPFMIII